jgi:hypothetical protein
MSSILITHTILLNLLKQEVELAKNRAQGYVSDWF